MAFSGVRISWLSVARNRSFARLAFGFPLGLFGFQPRCLFVSQQGLAVALHLFRITANGVGERLVNRLVETRHVIEVAQVWCRSALAPQSEHACAKSPVFSDHRRTNRNPTPPGRFRGMTMPALGHHSRPIGGLRLWISRPAAPPSDRTACPPPSRGGCLRLRRASRPVGRRPFGPDAARKRFPLHKNGFHVRQNEIRQAHSD